MKARIAKWMCNHTMPLTNYTIMAYINNVIFFRSGYWFDREGNLKRVKLVK